VPLCAETRPLGALAFPPRTLGLIWQALKREAPREVALAKRRLDEWRGQTLSSEPYDWLCAAVGRGLRAEHGPYEAVAQAADRGGGRQALAGCLDIAPLTRAALWHAPEWLGRMTGEKAAKLRLAYRDIVAVADDAGPRFFEMMMAHLAEPWLVLRIIAGVMDHPTESYVAASELGGFGERVLADVDLRLAELAAFKPTSGRQAAHAVVQSLHVITLELAELEQAFALTPDGVWGRRVAQQRHRLGDSVDAVLRAADRAVGRALPLHVVRLGPRTLRSAPLLDHDPDLDQAERAATLLTFVSEVRASAAAGGFAAPRARVLEALAARLDGYVEALLAEIHADDGAGAGRARAYLDVAAEFCGLVRDERSAQIVRRRAAVA
jgi:hypothetical protein